MDAIDITQITWHGTEKIPAPATLTMRPLLQGVEYRPGTPQQDRAVGVRPIVDASLHTVWPNMTPPGWTGTVRYTVCAIVKIDGHWHGAPCVTMYDGAWGTGAPILTQWNDWVYWSPAMRRYTPAVGHEIGWMLIAGGARFDIAKLSVNERSNIIKVPVDVQGVWMDIPPVVPMPADPPSVPVPEPLPAPDPVIPPAIPPADLSAVTALLERLIAETSRAAVAQEQTRDALTALVKVLS